MKIVRLAPLLIAVSLFASCGGDDGDDEKSAKSEALFTTSEVAPEVEKDIVRRAKREDRQAGNDPADYTYDVRCVPKSETRLTCRLDLTDKAGKTVNTVAYTAHVSPDNGEFSYRVTANRDTRKPANG